MILHNAVNDAEYKSESEYTKYLAVMGDLCGVFCEDFGENLPRYNGTTLYIQYMPRKMCVPLAVCCALLWIRFGRFHPKSYPVTILAEEKNTIDMVSLRQP